MDERAALSPDDLLIERVMACVHSPYRYTMLAYPWGEPGTELANKTGPRPWQKILLLKIEAKLKEGASLQDVIQLAVSSGHGVGKSALVAWLIMWAMSTKVDTRGVVTANTENQLRTKTWPELAKWKRLAINSHWFQQTATAIYSIQTDHEKTWRIDMIPWSDENTEAFAGLHNEGKRILLIFDEASAVPNKIWEVSEGALTDERTEIIWAVFGNPTRNSGRFFDCFGRLSHRWFTLRVDSREVEGTNKKQIQRWLEDYGEDSDFFRVRVRGLHPRSSDLQFIPSDLVYKAMHREGLSGIYDPLIMGVDIARGGSDRSVIWYRRGMDARDIPALVIPGYETRDTSRFVAKIADLSLTTDKLLRPDAVNVDGTGVGGPLIDRLRQLGVPVNEVQFKWAANDRRYGNFRAEMYAKLREALKLGLALPMDAELEMELCSLEYDHNNRDQLVLEPKDDLKDRIGVSPDKGDAVALTFAFPVEKREFTQLSSDGMANRAVTEYDPFARP